MKARSTVIVLSLLVAVASARGSGSSGYDTQNRLVEQGGFPPQAVKENIGASSNIGPNVGATVPPSFHEKGVMNQPLKSNVNQPFMNQPNIASSSGFRNVPVRTQATFAPTTVGGLGGAGAYRFGAGLGRVFRGFAAGATGYPYGATVIAGAPAYGYGYGGGYGTTLVTGAPAYGYPATYSSSLAYPAYSTVGYPATTYATTGYPSTELAYPATTTYATAYPAAEVAYPATTTVVVPGYGYGGRFGRFGYGRPWLHRGGATTTTGTLMEGENVGIQQGEEQPLMGGGMQQGFGDQQQFQTQPLGAEQQQPAAEQQPQQPQQPAGSDIIYSAPGVRIGGKAEVDAFRAEGEAKANAAQAAAGNAPAAAPQAPPQAPPS